MGTFAALWGCGGPPACAASSECRRGGVCGVEGHCTRLRPPPGARFAGSRWLAPTDWGVAGAAGPLTDELPVGGASEALLAFDPLPPSSTILRALLVLHPHERGGRVDERTELVVERVGRFEGGALPPRPGATPRDFAAARRLLAPGPARAVRLDVTEAARGAGGDALHLLVRVHDGDALLFASPWVVAESTRPRLELMVR